MLSRALRRTRIYGSDIWGSRSICPSSSSAVARDREGDPQARTSFLPAQRAAVRSGKKCRRKSPSPMRVPATAAVCRAIGCDRAPLSVRCTLASCTFAPAPCEVEAPAPPLRPFLFSRPALTSSVLTSRARCRRRTARSLGSVASAGWGGTSRSIAGCGR